jgi:hypothetical protein
MTSSDDLIQNVYAYFLKEYHAGAAGASGSEVVAFEPMGFSPGCVGVQGPGISNALQEVSRLADILPETDGGAYKETGRTISVQYSATIVEGAQPSPGVSVEAFSGLKSLARKLYNDAESDGELDGPKATLATPADWYDLQNASNWSTYSYDSSTQIQAPAPPAPQAPNVHLAWQVVNPEMRPQILERPSQFLSTPNPATGLRPMVARAPMMATAPVVMRPVAAPITAVAPRPTAVEIPPARPTAAFILTTRASVALVAAQTAPQPVESASFKLSFDYCLVHLRRPWLSGDFLAMPGWYVPTARGGDYSTGSPSNKGWFSALPTAFIAVKNLVISGSWSANDVAAAGNSAAFGPFSLMGISASQSGVLTNPGVQIIAWICSPQPKLPPDDDPKLALAAPATGS